MDKETEKREWGKWDYFVSALYSTSGKKSEKLSYENAKELDD
jgi:hypothetical protein